MGFGGPVPFIKNLNFWVSGQSTNHGSYSVYEFDDNFNIIQKDWNKYRTGNQEEFRTEIQKRLVYLDSSQDLEKIRLGLWIVRSFYSDGEIEIAINYYKKNIKEQYNELLFHNLYRSEMKKCKNTKCICDDMRKFDPNHHEKT